MTDSEDEDDNVIDSINKDSNLTNITDGYNNFIESINQNFNVTDNIIDLNGLNNDIVDDNITNSIDEDGYI